MDWNSETCKFVPHAEAINTGQMLVYILCEPDMNRQNDAGFTMEERIASFFMEVLWARGVLRGVILGTLLEIISAANQVQRVLPNSNFWPNRIANPIWYSLPQRERNSNVNLFLILNKISREFPRNLHFPTGTVKIQLIIVVCSREQDKPIHNKHFLKIAKHPTSSQTVLIRLIPKARAATDLTYEQTIAMLAEEATGVRGIYGAYNVGASFNQSHALLLINQILEKLYHETSLKSNRLAK